MCPNPKTKFEVFINSDDALNKPSSGTFNPNLCQFSLSSTGFSTNLSKYAGEAQCYVKLSYFSIDAPASTLTSSNTNLNTIHFDLMTASLPQSFNTNTISSINAAGALESHTIGLVPISSANATYSDATYDNNYVISSNLFQGDATILLKDQNRQVIDLSGRRWSALLCVYYDDDDYLADK